MKNIMKQIKSQTISTSYMVGVALWLYEEERNYSWLARKLSVSPACIHYWFAGITKPTQKNRVKIKEVTGINL